MLWLQTYSPTTLYIHPHHHRSHVLAIFYDSSHYRNFDSCLKYSSLCSESNQHPSVPNSGITFWEQVGEECGGSDYGSLGKKVSHNLGKAWASLSPLFNPSWRFVISIFSIFRRHISLYTSLKFLCSLEFCPQPSFSFPSRCYSWAIITFNNVLSIICINTAISQSMFIQ